MNIATTLLKKTIKMENTIFLPLAYQEEFILWKVPSNEVSFVKVIKHPHQGSEETSQLHSINGPVTFKLNSLALGHEETLSKQPPVQTTFSIKTNPEQSHYHS